MARMIALVLIGFCLLATAVQLPPKSNSASLKGEFDRFIMKYNKRYQSQEEYLRRFEIFKENALLSVEYQRKLDSANRPSKVSLHGKFADMRQEELRRKILSPRLAGDDEAPCSLSWGSNQRVEIVHGSELEFDAPEPLPAAFDWRTKGVVTRVKNQGTNGLSWAFAAVENIESQWAMAGHKLVSLSAQQLFDCDPYDCGLFGGWPCRAFQYIQKAGGVMAEADYPYCVYGEDECFPCPPVGYNYSFCGDPETACNSTRWPCRAVGNFKAAAKIHGYKWYKGLTEVQLQSLLLKVGPISVMVNSEGIPPLEFHESGIWSPWDCEETDPVEVDHAVLLVGWGVDKSNGNTPYWVMKNSWGEDWADEKGYFRMLRGHNTCGITLQVTNAIV